MAAATIIESSILAQSPAASTEAAQAVRFQTVSIMDDPRHAGGEAYRIVAPAGWRVEGSVMWKNTGSDPAAPWVKLFGPTHQEIGVLPPATFIWNPQMLGPRYRPGSFYSGTEVQPPMLDPAQCIRTIIIPRYRRNLDNSDIVKQEALPDVAQAGRLKYPQPEYKNAIFQAGKIRFEYVENNIPMEEDVYVLTASVQVPAAQGVSTMWTADEVRYLKAPKGTLDAQLPFFQTALLSLQPSLQWWARVQEVSHELGRLQAQTSASAAAQAMEQQAAAADRMIANQKLGKDNKPISNELLKRYQDRQAVMDRINRSWDHAVQVEAFQNPANGVTIDLPAGYVSAWVSAAGNYLLATSGTYDPGAGSNGSWTRLEKRSR